MNRLFISAALTAALTLPAFAGTDMAQPSGKDMKDVKQMAPIQPSDAGFYVAAYGGANFDTWYGDNRQTESVNATGSTTSTGARLNSHWGGVGGIKAGYNFESFDTGFLGIRLQPAVEAEGLYIGMDTTQAGGVFGTGSERLSTNSGDFFLNGILRFKNSSIVTPYIGGGVGLQYLTTHGDIAFPAGAKATGLNTSDLDFAGQGLIGFDVAVCNHVSLFTEYKFIDAIGTDGKNSGPGNTPGTTYRFKPDQIQQNLVTAGVKYTF